jgi:hypothetical protein
MRELIDELTEKLEGEEQLQEQIERARARYEEEHPGQPCEIQVLPGRRSLLVGPPIRKKRQVRMNLPKEAQE